MTWLDRAIAWASPTAALRREQARRALSYLEKQRSIDAAAHSRRTAQWGDQVGGPNTELEFTLDTVRDRARELDQNNGWAKAARRSLVSHAVGTGIIPEAVTTDRREARALDQAWAEHCGTVAVDPRGRTSIYGLMQALQTTTVTCGEALAVRLRLNARDPQPLPFQVMVLEPDYLDADKNAKFDDGSRVVQGVEINRRGQITGYWLHDEHPKEAGRYGSGSLYTTSRRFPAADVIHVGRAERAGQARFLPWGTACLLPVRDLKELQEAELLRAKVASCLVGVILDPNPGQVLNAPNQDPVDMEPGTFEIVKPGRDVKFNSPPTYEGFRPQAELTLMEIAAGFGVTYAQMTGDLAPANFSANRMGHVEVARANKQWQELGFIPQVCDRLWGWFLEAALLRNVTRNSYPASWTTPAQTMVDPTKEWPANKDRIRTGQADLYQVLREQGVARPEEKLQNLAQQLEFCRGLGLQLDVDGTIFSAAGVQALETDGERSDLAPLDGPPPERPPLQETRRKNGYPS